MNVNEFLEEIRRPGVRSGIGVWLLPPEQIGQEFRLALTYDLYPLDARQAFVDRLPQGAKYSGLTAPNGYQKLVEFIRLLLDGGPYPRDCLLVFNLDLLLLGLDIDGRKNFWFTTMGDFPYPRTKLILALNESAYSLIPDEIINRYRKRVILGIE